MKLSFILIVAGSCLLATGSVTAGTNGFIVPSFRGSAQSQTGYWEIFSTPVGAPGNHADRGGATTSAVLTQTNSTGFLTGSGNIYNLDNPSAFLLTDVTPFTLGTIVLQIRALGSELDYASMTLIYSNASGEHSLAPQQHVELSRGIVPGLGAAVASFWQWDLTGLDITAYTIFFRTLEPSLSFDSMTLDTAAQFTRQFTAPFALHDTLNI